MDHGDVGDGGILGQCLVDLIWIGGITLAAVDDRVVDGQHLRDPSDTPPVGAVGQDEQLVITSDGGTDQRLDDERTAPLHQHARVALGPCRQPDQRASNDLHDALVVIVVPRTPVAEHDLLHAPGRAERSGGEQ